MGANGALTVIGTFAGKPSYQAAGGWWYCWNPDGLFWHCRDALPGTGDLTNNRYAELLRRTVRRGSPGDSPSHWLLPSQS